MWETTKKNGKSFLKNGLNRRWISRVSPGISSARLGLLFKGNPASTRAADFLKKILILIWTNFGLFEFLVTKLDLCKTY